MSLAVEEEQDEEARNDSISVAAAIAAQKNSDDVETSISSRGTGLPVLVRDWPTQRDRMRELSYSTRKDFLLFLSFCLSSDLDDWRASPKASWLLLLRSPPPLHPPPQRPPAVVSCWLENWGRRQHEDEEWRVKAIVSTKKQPESTKRLNERLQGSVDRKVGSRGQQVMLSMIKIVDDQSMSCCPRLTVGPGTSESLRQLDGGLQDCRESTAIRTRKYSDFLSFDMSGRKLGQLRPPLTAL